MRLTLAAATLLMALSPVAFPQAFTGTITGVVTDPNGAAVPNAAVRARNEATQDSRQVVSNPSGMYTFSQLPPGTYEISAELQGFRKSVQSGAILRVNQTLEINISMQLGEVSQTVEVAAGATLLDTQTANRAVTLDQQAVLDLPTNARVPFQLVHVNAGVIAVPTGISQATQDQNHHCFSMNGGRGQAGLTLIDGVPAAAVDWGGLIASPSVDSVQEMNIQRNQFDAQFGKSDGGAVNMITRGGSNQFHGALFEFLRNNKLDANSWANNRSGLRRPTFQRNQFGATLGGPIWKSKKLFFFSTYEGRPLARESELTIKGPGLHIARPSGRSRVSVPDGNLSCLPEPDLCSDRQSTVPQRSPRDTQPAGEPHQGTRFAQPQVRLAR